jgi:DNA-directed RNA polymerase subunit RPC12/RpoP
VNYQPVQSSDSCSDCGSALEYHDHGSRCPACFDRYLFDLDAGFLESYRRFGCRSRLVVAETCLRGLVVDTPEHRKVLAMTIFEQYVQAMNDLAGLFIAMRNRNQAPVLKSFLEFRIDSASAALFFDAVQSVSNAQLCAALDLPMPYEVAARSPHLSAKDRHELEIAVHHLMQDLRKATDQGEGAAFALAQFAGSAANGVIANDARWLDGGSELTPDQVALLVLDSRRRVVSVQGLTADENAMGQVVDAIDTVTRAASNLIYAYLQSHNL